MRLTVALITILMSTSAFAETMTLKAGFNLRTKPSLRDGDVVTAVPRDTQVTVIDTARNFTLIRYQGKRFWVHSTGLTDTPDGSNLPRSGQILTAVRDRQQVRTAPGTMAKNGSILTLVNRDTEMVFVNAAQDSDGDTWYRVRFREGGRELTGFVYEGAVAVGQRPTTGSGTCTGPECQRERNNIQSQGQAILDAMSGKGFPLTSAFNGRCSNFINRNGLGDWGRRMVIAAKTVAPNCFYNDDAFTSLCSNYRSLNESQKNSFIALLFASIGHVESSCNPRAQAPGRYDIADGIFQLEYNASKRARAGRNPRWCRTGGKTDTQSWNFQAECAVSIIEDTVCDKDRKINYNSGYWEKLRNNRKISQMVRQTAKQWGICR